MEKYPKLRFGVIGIDHRHIYDQVRSLLDIGAECVGYWTENEVLTEKGFKERFPTIPRLVDRRMILEDERVQLVTCAAIPCDRARFAVESMRHGKDFMVDKPGVTTSEQLEQVRQVQRETGKIFSVNFTEHFEVRAVTKATELVRAGAIGKVIQTIGVGPHRFNRHLRPDWFFHLPSYGGILVDIASHQIEQFLHFAECDDARIICSRAGNVAHPNDPGFQDYGEIILSNGPASGYIHVNWFTPDALNTWGDGRLTIFGTEGQIELRKYTDVEGRPGKDHLFLVNNKESRYFDCSQEALPYYTDLRHDIFERTETAMSQSRCFRVCELALQAQEKAEPVPTKMN